MGEAGWQACLERQGVRTFCISKNSFDDLHRSIKGVEVLQEILQTEQPDVCLQITFSQVSERVRVQPDIQCAQ